MPTAARRRGESHRRARSEPLRTLWLTLRRSPRSRTVARITGILKLTDANWAGGPKGKECTLILTEGDSAKALAVAGLDVVGRDQFGVFPLRGKLLNVREASAAQLTSNTEIQHIRKIMGLKHGKVYTNREELRYGSLMIMTDQVRRPLSTSLGGSFKR